MDAIEVVVLSDNIFAIELLLTYVNEENKTEESLPFFVAKNIFISKWFCALL